MTRHHHLPLEPAPQDPADWLARIQRSDTGAASREQFDVWLLNALMHAEGNLAARRAWTEIVSIQCCAQRAGG
jgi:hypothetical protein